MLKRTLCITVAFLLLLLTVVIFTGTADAQWQAETPISVARDQYTCGVIDGKIYAFGGNGNPNDENLKSLEVFNPGTHSWSMLAPNEHNSSNGVEELTGAVLTGKFYVFGASGNWTIPGGVFNFNEEYDPVSKVWTSKADKLTTTSGSTAVVYGDEIYLFGGDGVPDQNDDRTPFFGVEAYNPSTNTWRVVTTIPGNVHKPTVAVVGAKAYLLGGYDIVQNQMVGDVKVYDFLTDQWITTGLAPVPTTRVRVTTYARAVPVIDGKIYIVGGAFGNATSFSILDYVDIYDPAANTWTTGPSLPVATEEQCTVNINSTIYSIGGTTPAGENNPNVRTNAVWKLSIPYGPGIVGKWGWSSLIHHNDSRWETLIGTLTFNSDGTGLLTESSNDNGTLIPEDSSSFTYSSVTTTNGTVALTLSFDGVSSETLHLIMSDNGNMMILDSIADTTKQELWVAVRMDASHLYSSNDLLGKYRAIGYDYDRVIDLNTDFPGHNTSYSTEITFNGSGSASKTVLTNSDGAFNTEPGSDTYAVLTEGILQMGSGSYKGHVSGDGLLAAAVKVGDVTDFETVFVMKQDSSRAYSNANLEGTWALSSIADEQGSSYTAHFGIMTCNHEGDCLLSLKEQEDGVISHHVATRHITVASDGTFHPHPGTLISEKAGSIGNNGNSIIINPSFQSPDWRETYIGVKCTNCSNIVQEKIPMAEYDTSSCPGETIKLSVYDPASGILSRVKDSCNDINAFGNGSLNSLQNKMVYTEELPDGTARINVYDISSGATTSIRTLTAGSVDASNNDMASYFDKNDRVIFNEDGLLKAMTVDGSGVNTIASPQAPYKFAVFWISNDRKWVAAVEYRDSGPDYETQHYERLVLINTDDSGRTVIKNEFLGEWNLLQWRPDSGQVIFFHHTFNGLPEGAGHMSSPQYVLIDIPGGSETNLCPSDLCQGESINFYTTQGYLLSLSGRDLYNNSGARLADFQSIMPTFGSVFFGTDSVGEMYFADLPDGANFRRFDFSLADPDNDGLPTDWEIANGLDPNDDGSINPDNGPNGNPDDDNGSNLDEYKAGSDPQNPDSRPVNIDIEIKVGLNMFSYPSTRTGGLTSYELLTILGTSDEIERILIYDKSAGLYKETYYSGTAPAGDNVALEFGDGILVYAKVDKTLSFNSTISPFNSFVECTTIDLVAGFNMAAFPCAPDGYSAHDLLGDLGETNVASVSHYDSATGMMKTAVYTNSQPAGADFDINAGEAYFIYMKQAKNNLKP